MKRRANWAAFVFWSLILVSCVVALPVDAILGRWRMLFYDVLIGFWCAHFSLENLRLARGRYDHLNPAQVDSALKLMDEALVMVGKQGREWKRRAKSAEYALRRRPLKLVLELAGKEVQPHDAQPTEAA